jgi:hypothetical protein
MLSVQDVQERNMVMNVGGLLCVTSVIVASSWFIVINLGAYTVASLQSAVFLSDNSREVSSQCV